LKDTASSFSICKFELSVTVRKRLQRPNFWSLYFLFIVYKKGRHTFGSTSPTTLVKGAPHNDSLTRGSRILISIYMSTNNYTA
jgi:hypothetical protein